MIVNFRRCSLVILRSLRSLSPENATAWHFATGPLGVADSEKLLQKLLRAGMIEFNSDSLVTPKGLVVWVELGRAGFAKAGGSYNKENDKKESLSRLSPCLNV
jgi:hypothetical protein